MKDYLSSSFVLNNDIDCSMTSDWSNGVGYDPVPSYSVSGAINPIEANGDYFYGGEYDGSPYYKHVTQEYYLYPRLHDSLLGPEGSDAMGSLFYKGTVGVLGEYGPNLGAGTIIVSEYSATGFMPIGDVVNPFSGTLNGNNKTISDLFMNWESDHVGLFGYLSGDVYDLTLENIDYTGTDYFGGLAGEQEKTSTITNVHVSGVLRGGYMSGGLVGKASGIILDSSTDITLVSYENSGGLVGVLEGEEDSRATISNSSSSGAIEGEPFNIGGLVGLANQYTDIVYSHSDATVDGWSWGMGGLVGRTSGTVTDSYAIGDVSSYYGFGIGGLIGKMVGATARVERSYATGNVTAKNASSPNVNDTPTSFAGGLVGYSDAGGVYQSFATGDVSGTGWRVGGLIGGTAGVVENCYAAGNVKSSTGEIYEDEDVYGENNMRVGGLVGGLSSTGKVENSYATGNVDGFAYVGGLVGYSINGEIKNSFTTGYANGRAMGAYVGGVVGVYPSNPSADLLSGAYWYARYGEWQEYMYCYQYPDGEDLGFGNDNCTLISTEDGLEYFYSSQNDPMLENWNFDTVWLAQATDYPIFQWQEVVDQQPELTPTPQPVSEDKSASSNTSTTKSSSPKSDHCSAIRPVGTPNLFQVDVTATTAKLFFTPLSDTDEYFISFAEHQHAEEHGEQVSLLREGVQSHTVYFLRPNTTYYFKVRGQKGCATGEWSNTMQVKTKQIGVVPFSFYKYFPNKVIINTSQTIVKPISKLFESQSNQQESTTTVASSPTTRQVDDQKNQPQPEKKQRCFLWWCW